MLGTHLKYSKRTFEAAFDNWIFFFSHLVYGLKEGSVRFIAKIPVHSVRSIARQNHCENLV